MCLCVLVDEQKGSTARGHNQLGFGHSRWLRNHQCVLAYVCVCVSQPFARGRMQSTVDCHFKANHFWSLLRTNMSMPWHSHLFIGHIKLAMAHSSHWDAVNGTGERPRRPVECSTEITSINALITFYFLCMANNRESEERQIEMSELNTFSGWVGKNMYASRCAIGNRTRRTVACLLYSLSLSLSL